MSSGTETIKEHKFKDGFVLILDSTYDSYSEKYEEGEETYGCYLMDTHNEDFFEEKWYSRAYDPEMYSKTPPEIIKRFNKTVAKLSKKHDKISSERGKQIQTVVSTKRREEKQLLTGFKLEVEKARTLGQAKKIAEKLLS